MVLNNIVVPPYMGPFLFLNGMCILNHKYNMLEKICDILDRINFNENQKKFIWNFLHAYSKANIVCKKYVTTPFHNYILSPISSMFEGTILDINRVLFVRDGKVILCCGSLAYAHETIDFFMLKYSMMFEYDFIVFYPKNQNTMILYKHTDLPKTITVDNNSVNSTVSFMACQLVIHTPEGDVKKNLELDEFMINGNEILTKEFILWYCKTKFSDLSHVDKLDDYTIYLLDNDINEKKLTPDNGIIINANTYITVIYTDSESSSQSEEEDSDEKSDSSNHSVKLEKIDEENEPKEEVVDENEDENEDDKDIKDNDNDSNANKKYIESLSFLGLIKFSFGF